MFSALDANSSTWPVCIVIKDVDRTAFVTNQGMFKYRCVLYGFNTPHHISVRCGRYSVINYLETCDGALQLHHYLFCDAEIPSAIHIYISSEFYVSCEMRKWWQSKCNSMFWANWSVVWDMWLLRVFSTQRTRLQAINAPPCMPTTPEMRSFLELRNLYFRFVLDFTRLAFSMNKNVKKT